MKISAINSAFFAKTHSINQTFGVYKQANEQNRIDKSVFNFSLPIGAYNISFGKKNLSQFEVKPIKVQDVKDNFNNIFNEEPEHIIAAPGRSVIAGEHVDYQKGNIISFATDCGTMLGVSENDSTKVKVYSDNMNDYFEFDLAQEPDIDGYKSGKYKGRWGNYAEGTIRKIVDKLEIPSDELKGMNIYLKGNVPTGAGLSSSASLEMALAKATLAVYGKKLPDNIIAQAGREAEHEYAGANCGILDQLTSVSAKKDSMVLMECKGNTTQSVPATGLNDNYKIIICNSGVKHSIAASGYNDRVRECISACNTLKNNLYPDIDSLSDISADNFRKDKKVIKELLEPEEYKRTSHIVSENERVDKGIEALKKGDYKELGKIMFDCHKSLNEDMEVSCPELNELVELAKKGGATGSKMSGGGFGGSTVNLVANENVDKFIDSVLKYYDKQGKEPQISIVNLSEGAHEIK